MGKIVTIRFNDDELIVLYKIMMALGIKNRSRAIKLVLLLFDLIFLEGLSLAELLKNPKELVKTVEEKLNQPANDFNQFSTNL